MSLHLPSVLSRVSYRYPFILVDAVTEYEPGGRLVAHKNITVSEEFFQGHFPGTPILPAVLMIEALTQVAACLVLDREGAAPNARASLRGVDNAKFRRQVVPGDLVELPSAPRGRPSSRSRNSALKFREEIADGGAMRARVSREEGT